jgi:hypothetical protein
MVALTKKPLSDIQRYILMRSLAYLGTQEALLSAMSLYEKGSSTRVPSAIKDVIEKQVLLSATTRNVSQCLFARTNLRKTVEKGVV